MLGIFHTHHWRGAVLSPRYLATQPCIHLQKSPACMAWCLCPLLSAIVGGGKKCETMTRKSTFWNAPCCLQNLLVTFLSPHSCTKASVVFIAGTAIRIMRPKGLSISQEAWLGKNKPHLSPGGAQTQCRVMTNVSHSVPLINNTPTQTNIPLWSGGTRDNKESKR